MRPELAPSAAPDAAPSPLRPRGPRGRVGLAPRPRPRHPRDVTAQARRAPRLPASLGEPGRPRPWPGHLGGPSAPAWAGREPGTGRGAQPSPGEPQTPPQQPVVHNACVLGVHTRVQEPVDTRGAVGGCGERRGAAAGGRGETFLTALVILSGSKSVPGMFLIPGSIPAPAAPGPPPRPPLHPTPGLLPTARPHSGTGAPSGGSAFRGPLHPQEHPEDTQRCPNLGGCSRTGRWGDRVQPHAGAWARPHPGPRCRGRRRVPNSCQGHGGSSASPTRRLAPSLTRSQRREQQQGFRGALGMGLRDAPHVTRELEAAAGLPWPWGCGVGTPGTATLDPLPWGSHACSQARGAAGRPGVFVRCRGWVCKGWECKELTRNPTHASGGVCPAPRGRRRGRAWGPRVCPEPWEPRRQQLWVFSGCFLAHPLRRGLGRGTRGAPGPWTHLPR